MLMLAVFNMVMVKYTKREDIVMGTDIANRSYETETIIGLFVNQVVLRMQIRKEEKFGEILEKIRETTLEAYSNKEVPFNKLVEEINPKRSASYNPIFQVMFVMQNIEAGTLELEGLEVKRMQIESQESPFDISVHLWEETEKIKGVFRYNTDLYNKTTIEQVIECYKIFLEKSIENINETLSNLIKLVENELNAHRLEKQIQHRASNIERLKEIRNKGKN